MSEGIPAMKAVSADTFGHMHATTNTQFSIIPVSHKKIRDNHDRFSERTLYWCCIF